MFRFGHSEFLWLLLALPLFVFVYLIISDRRKKAINAFAEKHMQQYIMPEHSATRRHYKMLLYIIATALTIFAISDPQFGTKLEEVKRSGIDLVIALDVSNSMKAEDLSPNRLQAAKRAIDKLVDKLQGDRIGLVVFGGQAYVQLPITTDYAAAKLFLQTIDTDIVPTQGTAIGAAIETSMESFSKNSKNKKAIIIITDGENHEDDAIKQAEEAKSQGIIVHTIGMGSVQGAPIPAGGGTFKKDSQGTTVITKLNEEMLQQIATAGNGLYVRANNSQVGLNMLFDEINKMDKKEYGSKQFVDYENRFQYLLLPALLILIIELLISERQSKWWRKLFNTQV